MLRKLLIANRGEIACRIARTARRLGVATVAVHSDADRGALHVHAADEAIHIGAAPSRESYLDIDRIIAAARTTNCDAIHPGYGFLSENPLLADACATSGLIFVGPTAAAMRALGGKSAGKALAIAAGVPVIPGYHGAAQDPAVLAAQAQRIGYPLLVKASAGGGGRGMRLVRAEAEMNDAIDSARAEALSAFSDGTLLIEKLVERPRHIEVQIFGDTHGNVVHLFERDCSLQRRNQKVIEEAPAPGMSEALRAKMTSAAVTLARSVGYTGAGTVEFLVEGGSLDASAPWWFIEMNTRLQVEHPVTEAITGLDLVEWQLRVASGEQLPLRQDEIAICGHAIEARLNAEQPARHFMPSIGTIVRFAPTRGEGVRVDTGVESGSIVSPHYDSLLAKIIAAAADRATAIARIDAALAETCVLGLPTNRAFLSRLLGHPDLIAGCADTGLIARDLDNLTALAPEAHASAAAAAARALLLARAPTPDAPTPWAATDAFTLGPQRTQRVDVAVEGEVLTMYATWPGGTLVVRHGTMVAGSETAAAAIARDRTAWAAVDGVHAEVTWPDWRLDTAEASPDRLLAPIDGRVAMLAVAVGDIVEAGQRIATIEAMKMEHVLAAPRAGRITELSCAAGRQIAKGTLVARIEDA